MSRTNIADILQAIRPVPESTQLRGDLASALERLRILNERLDIIDAAHAREESARYALADAETVANIRDTEAHRKTVDVAKQRHLDARIERDALLSELGRMRRGK